MELRDSIVEKQIVRTALLGPALMALAFAIAAVQARFSLQPLLGIAVLSMLASWKWQLKGWYASVLILMIALGFLSEYSLFNVAFAAALSLSCWITAMSYSQIEIWMKELMVEGAKQHVSAVGQLEKQVSALQQLETQKEIASQRTRSELQDSRQQVEHYEQELKQYRSKAEGLFRAYESKETSLLQQLVEVQASSAIEKKELSKLFESKEAALLKQLGNLQADSAIEKEKSLQWQQKAQQCEELESKCADTLKELEQWKQRAQQCDELEVKYARALSDIEQWQLRVQQLMELAPEQPQTEALEIEEAKVEDPQEAEEPKVEAPKAKAKAKSESKSKSTKNKKTNHWANAILSRWSDPEEPSQ